MSKFVYILLIIGRFCVDAQAQVLSVGELKRAKIYSSIEAAAKQPDSVFVLELTAFSKFTELSKFKNLNILRLYDHQLDVEDIDFSHLPSLQELVLKATYQFAANDVPPKRLYRLTSSIASLKNLKKLDLSNNALGLGTGLDAVANLAQLEVLNLSNNEIGVEYFIEETIAEQVEIHEKDGVSVGDSLYKTIRADIIDQYLYAGSWTGEDLLPLLISKLDNLQDLDVSSNYLRDVPESIKNLKGLKRLNLADNHIYQLPVGLCELADLERLYAERNYIHTLPEDIGKLQQLQKLTLYQNPLYLLPTSFGQLSQIRELQFERNSHLDWMQVFEVLKNMDNLMKLEIRQCRIEKMPVELTKLRHLQELTLYNNDLLRFPDHIDQLTQLRTLIIVNADLYKLPDGIKKLQHLQTLVIYGCNELNWDAAFQLLGEAVCLSKLRLDISYNKIEKWPESTKR
ncbi:MAG: hypothetical protein MK212_21845, partial [Saprospiraceae bacterium]|nr:hypothetical protein [Saprospiraceae bacterium]